ncbi:ribosomal protection-like ABC-F family protein [Halothermothrix orenii]|uniref:ABC transporter related n=1 Tax=Halothermothrix orenii (strain H 168 / OCM 544 / DSM 9562) TaxID=373903 RepID=B8CXY7_HALOH|nr:ABC-F type ribosomal protection protein [Halothermothrix orenii]ACL70156.1 ABC transporter related [Halothermothrix orenii H 168]
MSVVSIRNINKSYGIEEVLKGFSLDINQGEKVGLIGVNGSGKTTLFKIICGLEPVSSGDLVLKKGLSIGYLNQMPDFNPENTLYQELKKVFSDLIMMEREINNLEIKIAEQGKRAEDDEDVKFLMKKYSKLRNNFEMRGGYGYNSKIKQVAVGLGFTHEELDKKVGKLSGGEKTRLGLVKLLLSEPDLLLLDEPTNHLDLSSIDWLENFLQDYRGTVIVISHDRYFLDHVVDRIVELRDGRDEVYYGNYSYYLKERKKRYEQQLKKYENQQKEIKKMEEAIKRLRQWGSQGDNQKFFKKAKSMEKALERMEKIDKPTLDDQKIKLDFSVEKRSGNEVLRVESLSKSFGTNVLFEDLKLGIYWGEKVAVIGKNGTGKTTLLKIITGDLKPDSGRIKLGSNVRIGYYSQTFEGFDPEDDLVTALQRELVVSEGEARNKLASFLFTGDDVFKKVKDLSGGEKSRLRLLQLMYGDYNFLVLDEPTNHLDLTSREVLEEALKQYPGTMLIVSHDRYLLNKVTNLTYELEDGSLTKYHGNYDYYLKKKKQLNGDISSQGKSGKEEKTKSDYELRKEQKKKERKRKKQLKRLEEDIEALEVRKETIEQEMVRPENLDDFELLASLKEEYMNIEQELNELYSRWEKMI